MKIIHVADVHLDSKMQSNFDREKAKERRHEILGTFTRMIDYAAENSVDAILIAGDLFDTAKVSALARNTVADAIRVHPDIDFYILKGNHDRDNFLSDVDDPPSNLKTFTGRWSSYALDDDGLVVLTATELSSSNANSIYSTLVLDSSKLNIVMLHGQDSVATPKDATEIVNVRELKNKFIDYLALGHVHSYKSERLDARGVYCYPGCLEGRGFDEEGEHGFVLLDIDVKVKSIKSTFVPFANRNIYSIEVDISEAGSTSDIIGLIDAQIQSRGISARHILKIVLNGEVDIEAEKDASYITKHYTDSFYLVKVYDETRLLVNYEDYLLDESLKGEFVRAIMNADDISENDKPAVIRMGLRAIAGEEIEI